MEAILKVRYKGLISETLPSGDVRYRVRVKGKPNKRILLHAEPGDKNFSEAYHAARRGIEFLPEIEPIATAISGSISWLTYKHIEDLEKKVEAGLASPLTLKKRKGIMEKLRARSGEYSIEMPTSEVVKIRDELNSTPAMADSMVEAIRSMYRWAISIEIASVNPATGVGKIDKGKGGAVPWSVDDLKQYKKRHPKGTRAYLALTLFMFTACRITDAKDLGRGNERTAHGVRSIGWQPSKKGSAYVEVPLVPQLFEATRSVKVFGAKLPYLLKQNGTAYATGDNLGQQFRKWCRQAGLENRSSHGIRKAAGHLLAELGCTQYQIMCIHGHTNAKTSEVYTKGVERWNLAQEAMLKLARLEW